MCLILCIANIIIGTRTQGSNDWYDRKVALYAVYAASMQNRSCVGVPSS